MTASELTRQAIELLKPGLQEEGYTIYFQPDGQFLPPFMGSYIPDAIAIGPEGKKKLAIEVVASPDPKQDRITNLNRVFASSSDWQLKLIYANPEPIEEFRLPPSTESIRTSIGAIERLISDQQFAPAMLMGWATLEALGRLLLPARFVRALPPSGVVSTLAGEGCILPSQADFLRKLALVRNQLTHGRLDMQLSAGDLQRFAGILKELLALYERDVVDRRSNA